MQEVTIWVTAMLTLVGFGLSLGINPALYGATADMLARGTNPWPRLLAMTGGFYLGATGLFVLF